VLYLVMDAIAERGFKHLARAFLHYLVIAAVAFTLLIGGLVTKGFGYASKIPSLSNVESIDFSYSDYSNLVLPSPNNYGSEYMLAGPTLHLTSASDIAAVHELHQIIISEFKWIDYNFGFAGRSNTITSIEAQKGYTKSYETLPFYLSNDAYSPVEVKIVYHLKSGGDFERSYSIPVQWTKVLLTLNNSPEIIKLSTPNLGRLDQYPNVAAADWITPFGKSNIAPLKLKLSDLKTAYLLDIAALSDAQSISTDYTAMGYLNLTTCKVGISNCITSSVDVDTRFTHVIAVLTATGVNLNPAPEIELPKAALLIPGESPSALIVDYPLFKVAMPQSSQRYTYDLLTYYNESQPLTFTYVNLTDDQLVQIMPYVTQKGISDSPLLALVLENGAGNLLIQAQYEDEVMAIITANARMNATDLYSIFASSITK
jgi:hypothetical protein